MYCDEYWKGWDSRIKETGSEEVKDIGMSFSYQGTGRLMFNNAVLFITKEYILCDWI